MLRYMFAALVVTIGAILPCMTFSQDAESGSRTWTDSTGQFRIEAALIGYADGMVQLKKSDGQELAVPLNKLSREDQAFLRAYVAASRQEPAGSDELPGTELPGTAGMSDWPVWRGPQFNGEALATEKPPVRWSDSENVIWKSPVPGRGHSSPIVSGQRIILTTTDEARQVQSVLCYQRSDGRLLWKRDVNQGALASEIHNKNTHASPTPACDGRLIYAVFPNRNAVQLVALNMDGDVQWQTTAGPFQPQKYQFGYAASPLLYQSTVIVAADSDQGGYLSAFDCATGKQVWKTPRPNGISLSSPVVASIGGRDQLLISGCEIVASYDPRTGKPLWSADATTFTTCGTMVWDGDLVFASGGYPESETVAIRADGSGRVAWRNREKCYEQSMLAHNGYVYAINDNGIAFCWDSQTGREQWKTRLGGPISASPILAGGNIYATNERGTTFVFAATPDGFKPIAQNQLGDEAFATPAFCGNQIFARVAAQQGGRQETLYCIGTN